MERQRPHTRETPTCRQGGERGASKPRELAEAQWLRPAGLARGKGFLPHRGLPPSLHRYPLHNYVAGLLGTTLFDHFHSNFVPGKMPKYYYIQRKEQTPSGRLSECE